MNRLLCAVLIVVLLLMAISSAFACGGSRERFVATESNKPQIALENLSAEQRAELRAFASSFVQTNAAAHSEMQNNKITESEAEQRIRNEFKTLRETVPFITTIEVGNGMLCGARIKVEFPPRDQDLQVVLGPKRVLWLIRGEARNRTADEGHLDPDQLL